MLAVTLLAPGPPLLFMGDEWGAQEPFPFFCDFKGELAQAVREGRRREFAEAYAKHEDVPDPLSEQTMRLASLDWSAPVRPDHAARLAWVRSLLGTRSKFIMPRLPEIEPGPGRVSIDDGVLSARWNFRSSETLVLLANLSGNDRNAQPSWENATPIWGGMPPPALPPWSVHAAIEAP